MYSPKNHYQPTYKIEELGNHLGDYSEESPSLKYLKKLPPKQDIKYDLFK